jgi:hypothetical protein
MKVRANTSGTLIFYLSFPCSIKIKINKSSSDFFGDEFLQKNKNNNSPKILKMEYSFENSLSKRKNCLMFEILNFFGKNIITFQHSFFTTKFSLYFYKHVASQ